MVFSGHNIDVCEVAQTLALQTTSSTMDTVIGVLHMSLCDNDQHKEAVV